MGNDGKSDGFLNSSIKRSSVSRTRRGKGKGKKQSNFNFSILGNNANGIRG